MAATSERKERLIDSLQTWINQSNEALDESADTMEQLCELVERLKAENAELKTALNEALCGQLQDLDFIRKQDGNIQLLSNENARLRRRAEKAEGELARLRED